EHRKYSKTGQAKKDLFVQSLRCYVNVKRQLGMRGAGFGLRCSIDSFSPNGYLPGKTQAASRGAWF
ncbi:MAG TPA: hypothetical protein VFU37_15905, partial [Pyrinomonadaceae bacterium]|nr:hypothetical protein [Pyrinomonadaceae bacterium]